MRGGIHFFVKKKFDTALGGVLGVKLLNLVFGVKLLNRVYIKNFRFTYQWRTYHRTKGSVSPQIFEKEYSEKSYSLA